MIPAQRWRDPGANSPHVMRHAFGDHVARHAGIKNAQALLGHADVETTQICTGAIKGIRFALEPGQTFHLLQTR